MLFYSADASCICFIDCALLAEFRNRKYTADLVSKSIRYLCVARDCLDFTGIRIAQKRVGSTFPFEIVAVVAEMLQ